MSEKPQSRPEGSQTQRRSEGSQTQRRPEGSQTQHVAILGAGPIGLEAALAAAESGYPFTVYEAAPAIAGHVESWGHVSLFTPWELNISPRMRAALSAAGLEVPAGDACPTGRELVERILKPIAELPQIQGHLRLGTTVRRVGRRGLLKHEEIGSTERGRRRFRLLVSVANADDSSERVEEADLVLDCTGLTEPNALGDGGIPALGEETLDGAIYHRIPDLEKEAADWAGKRVLLVGAGHSGQTAACELLGCDGAGIQVIWALRGEPKLEPVADDPLPERARLTAAAGRLVADPPPGLDVRSGVVIEALERSGEAIRVTLRRTDGSTESVSVDRILALTGRVGDHQLYRQLQVHECYATSGPMKLAAALLGAGSSAAGGDCLQQTSQGADTLKNPEPGFFILGSKSYGRRTDFLMRVGWEQVGEVFELLGE